MTSELPTNIPQRLLSREQAAQYLGVSLATFDDWRRKHTIPGIPGPLKGTTRYDRHALDKALDQASGLVETDEKSAAKKWIDDYEARSHS